jgi:hypothetical protein
MQHEDNEGKRLALVPEWGKQDFKTRKRKSGNHWSGAGGGGTFLAPRFWLCSGKSFF